MLIKRCSACHRNKLTSEFYRDNRKLDGLYSCCKHCHNKRTKRYDSTEKGKKSKRSYWLSQCGRETHRRAALRYYNTEKGKNTIRNWNKKNWRKYYHPASPKRKAHWAISNAIRYGKIQKPSTQKCNYCGKQAKEYHHHLGYSYAHRLDVIPLCKSCHIKVG